MYLINTVGDALIEIVLWQRVHLCTGGRARDGALFSQVAKGTHLPAAPSPKRPKRGPGHPRKVQPTIVRIDDSDIFFDTHGNLE